MHELLHIANGAMQPVVAQHIYSEIDLKKKKFGLVRSLSTIYASTDANIQQNDIKPPST